MLQVTIGEIEGQHVQCLPVNDHELGVIPVQVIGRASHGHARGQEAHFELPQSFRSRAACVRDQRTHAHATVRRSRQCSLNVTTVKAEDHDVDTLLRAIDGVHYWQDTIVGLQYKVHALIYSRRNAIALSMAHAVLR